ncbi:MAG: type II toxin-antitoxin system RelE/ParE family toxin [Pseudomonadota bacterium]
MNKIQWTTKALRQARKLPPQVQSTIAHAVDTLERWPHVEQVKALQGREGYRLRIGRYRILFTVHSGIPLIIQIEEVKKRDEHTY